MKPTISRQGHLAEKIVIVDGQPGCGKTMLSSIIAAMDRVELLSYAFEIEFICRLFKLNKIDEDAAVAMVRMLTDHKLYQTMMGRDTNFRFSDLSSVFKDSNPWRYFKRIFQEGDTVIPERIKEQKPILHLTVHDLLGYSKPVFIGLNERVFFIEVVRHPLYMLIQQTLNMERLLNNPRDIAIYFKYKNTQLPYFAHQIEDLFESSNAVEQSIYTLEKATVLSETFKDRYFKRYGKQILTIPFESFVLDPWPFMKKIELALESKVNPLTKKMMKKQKVPRERISDGIPLPIYKRCGWEPPQKSLNERQELEKRRQFVIENGASEKAMNILDILSAEYEKKYFTIR